MAEHIDPTANDASGDATSLTRRARAGRTVAARAPRAPKVRTAVVRERRGLVRPLRSLAVLTMVGGLVATAAIPAFAAIRPGAGTQTLQQAAADNAQSLVIASDTTDVQISRQSYAATTQAEIDKKKADEAAAAAAAAAAASSARVASVYVNLSLVAPGSGEVRWPLASGFTLGDGFRSRGGEHMGIDMLAPGGTPIFAAAAGVVRVSQESYYGYGNAVVIDHVINGQRISTLYGHMTSGSRVVSAGQTVAAGQIIGLVGSTGQSTANHLHFEVFIDGTNVDPLAFLQANAG